MKFTTKASLAAASFVSVAAGSAFADNAQHRNLLAMERARHDQGSRVTTVAAYTNDRGVGKRAEPQQQRSATRFEIRTNAHGDNFIVAAPVR